MRKPRNEREREENAVLIKTERLLIRHLSEDEIVLLSQVLDGSPEDVVLDMLNRWIKEHKPEVFESKG